MKLISKFIFEKKNLLKMSLKDIENAIKIANYSIPATNEEVV